MADLRALLDAATPGPWIACTWDPMEAPHIVPEGGTHHPSEDIARRLGKANAELVAALVNAAPALLDVVEAAEDPGGEWHDCACSWHARLRYALRRLEETR